MSEPGAIQVVIVDGPLPAHTCENESCAGNAGAVVCFDGVVRRVEDGHDLVALEYEAYEPMAEQELTRLAQDIATTHGLLAIDVWHSRGRIAVGETSFRLVIASAHRREALTAMGEFIDLLKKDVPIWKHAVFATKPLPHCDEFRARNEKHERKQSPDGQ